MNNEKPTARRPVEYVTRALLGRLCAAARASARGRTNHNFHTPVDGYQRMLNVIQPASYVRPHHHREPAKAESFVVLQGEIGLFCFADDGTLTECRRMGPRREALAVDLQSGVWHCFLALEPDTVVFEGKNGPYDPTTDKTFAPWAPAEGDPEAGDYMRRLLEALPGA